MKITVERIITLFCLFCWILLLPACKSQEVSAPNSSELCSSQSSENKLIETPAITPSEQRSESSATSDAATFLTDESSLPSIILENTSEEENTLVTSSEIPAVSSSSSDISTAPPPASSPSEVAIAPEMPIPELTDSLPPESSAVPSVEAMDSSYLCDLIIGVNSHRTRPLNMEADLSASAQAHTEEMAQTKNLYHSCSGVESVGKGALEDGVKEGSLLTVHCSDLASDELLRIGVGAARDEDGSIYVCILGKTY